jgi:hypothetical protein
MELRISYDKDIVCINIQYTAKVIVKLAMLFVVGICCYPKLFMFSEFNHEQKPLILEQVEGAVRESMREYERV